MELAGERPAVGTAGGDNGELGNRLLQEAVGGGQGRQVAEEDEQEGVRRRDGTGGGGNSKEGLDVAGKGRDELAQRGAGVWQRVFLGAGAVAGECGCVFLQLAARDLAVFLGIRGSRPR